MDISRETSSDESFKSPDKKKMELSSETSSDECCKPSDIKDTHICNYDECSATFTKKSRLVYHMRRHTGERPFVCEEPNCGKTYLYSFHLRRHKETFHSNPTVERIPCPHEGCDLELANKHSLKKHMKIKHNSNRQYPFNCNECQQGFLRKRQLLHHSYVHTGVFPFACDICEMKFPTMRARNRHKRTHTSYSCKCGEKFERWSTLLLHKKTCESTKLKCSVCNKIFKQLATLKNHVLLHLDEKDDVYQCGYDNCNRSYSYKKNLIYHIEKYHKNALPRVACTHPGCDYTASKQQTLKSHVKRCHSNVKLEDNKPRRPRKDKGKAKKSTAAELAQLELPLSVHQAILKGKSIKQVISKEVLNNEPTCIAIEVCENNKESSKNLSQETLKEPESELDEALITQPLKPKDVLIDEPTCIAKESCENHKGTLNESEMEVDQSLIRNINSKDTNQPMEIHLLNDDFKGIAKGGENKKSSSNLSQETDKELEVQLDETLINNSNSEDSYFNNCNRNENVTCNTTVGVQP